MRGWRRDAGVGAVAALFGLAATIAAGGVPLVVVAAAILGGALALPRRHPTTAWIVATMALALASPDGTLPLASFMLVPAHAFSAGRWAGRWSSLTGIVAIIGVAMIGVAVSHDSAVPFLIVPATTWAAGRAVRERELVATRLARRAQELEAEREAYAELSVRYERARIASELHDIVAHAISVMVVQASAGQRVAAVDPELTAETFQAIAGAAMQAEQDMGRLVALLGDADAIAEAPDLALVEELVVRAAKTGLDVTLRLEGTREGLPVTTVQAAYRVVQESLTNALRYASGAAVRVLIRGDADVLLVEIANGPAPHADLLAGHGTGNGLRGLRELLSACGGRLEAEPTPEGGWRVGARLPRAVTVQAT